MRLLLRHTHLCCRALRAVWRAYLKSRRPRPAVEPTKKMKRRERRRKRALRRLGGACACCGLPMDEFWRVLAVHHVNHNGSEHRATLPALGVSIEGQILTAENPTEGLFAVTPLCLNCHAMIHYAGACSHRRKVERAA